MRFKYRPEIDGLRALAVMSVIIFHADFEISYNGETYTLLPGGFLGVDVFYVISGYLISYLILQKLETNSFTFLDFYERRARRILPTLFLIILLSLFAGYILMMPNQYKDLSSSAISSLLFVSNIWFYFTDNYFAEPSLLKPLLHTWSLSIEEQFYILFPPLLFFCHLKKKRLIFYLLILILISLVFSQLGSSYFKDLNFYIILSRVWELAFGSLIAVYHIYFDANQKIKYSNLLEIVALSLIIIPFFIFNENTQHPSIMTSFTIVGTSILIYLRNFNGILIKILSSKIFVGTGLISYSLYLWHYPVFAFKKIKSSSLSEFDKLESIFLVIILSLLSYFLVEKPFRNKNLINKKIFIKVIASIFTVIFLFSAYIIKTDGLPKRFSQEVLDLIDFNYDYKTVYRVGTCLIENKQKAIKPFFNNCETKLDENKKNILIWGDSLAAHLYPGINNKYGLEFNIFQRTIGACKPYFKENIKDKDFCSSINNSIVEEILILKPSKIFLSGFWKKEDLENIKTIIDFLKNKNINQIYLVGPSPRWHDPLPKILYKEYRLKRKIPKYLPDENHKKFFELDKLFMDFSVKNSIKYLSPIKILCKKNYTCLVKTENASDSIVNWDENHFTEKASKFIFSKFID